MSLTPLVQSLANGEALPTQLLLTWGIHEGIRGAGWLEVFSSGRVVESRYQPTTNLASLPPATELGPAPAEALQRLARTLLEHNFEALEPPPPDEDAGPASTQVELSVAAGDERFSLLVYSYQMDQVSGLAQIAAAFSELRRSLSGQPKLRCPQCGSEHTLPVVFAVCDSSFPIGYWLFCDCPACGEPWVLELGHHHISLGELEEFPPGPYSFVPFQELAAPGLTYDLREDGILLHYGGQSWFIPE